MQHATRTSPEISGHIRNFYNAALEPFGYGERQEKVARDCFLHVIGSPEPVHDGDRGSVLIVDEAQNLKPRVLESLRIAQDEAAFAGAGFGVVLCGNLGFIDRRGRGITGSFAQLTSRVGMRLRLDAPGRAEIEGVLRSEAAPIDADALEVLVSYGVKLGNFRAPLKVAALARNGANGGPITAKLIEMGIRLVEGV